MTTDERAAAVMRISKAADRLEACTSLEGAAQGFCDLFYRELPETALIRVFATVPFGRLGERERRFVSESLDRDGRRLEFAAGDPVLTLFGTRGIEPAWSSRLASRDHLAIPLNSEEFVAEIPMISRLLGELGVASIRSRNGSWQFVSRLGTGGDGLFFVGDARSATDERGRLIIPATEFVDRYGIRTVFGFGGEVAGQSMLLSVIAFSRSVVARSDAGQFVPLFGRLREATKAVLERQSLFSAAA